MISKVKSLIAEFRNLQHQQLSKLKELEWAHVYHDSIRGNKTLHNLPLNIGRWAGNYSFFYVLHRILKDTNQKAILELGLGESSKFVSACLKSYGKTSKHTIVEHDEEWKRQFTKGFTLEANSEIEIFPLEEKEYNNEKYNAYDGLLQKDFSEYTLFIVDGPFGTPRYSRFDIVEIVRTFEKNKEFVILVDDYNRDGEEETVKVLLDLFKEKNMNYKIGVFKGDKNQILITSHHFSFLITV